MKKITLALMICFIFSFSLVSALPVTYIGTITVDGGTEDNVNLIIETNLENYNYDVDGGVFRAHVEGDEGTDTRFYIFGSLVNTTPQASQATTNVEMNLSFDRLANGKVCTQAQACKSKICCNGVCASSCNTGGGGSSGGGSTGFRYTQCNDDIDNDGDGLIDYYGKGNKSKKDPECKTGNTECESPNCKISVDCPDKKSLICHKTSSSTNPWVELCVDDHAVNSHIKRGGYLGECKDEIDNELLSILSMVEAYYAGSTEYTLMEILIKLEEYYS